MKMMELFNTPFETALRVLLLLETGARTDFSINMIAALDLLHYTVGALAFLKRIYMEIIFSNLANLQHVKN